MGMDKAYQALYRSYRPQKFADVAGQPHAVAILKNAVAKGRLAHAYLFSGPRGTGKTTLARILAKAANCEHPTEGEPCLACTPCTESQLHTVEIDAASNRGIDEIRDLRERSRYLPPVGSRKVYIVDEAHMLTPEAFNALLKTLEEPPGHLLFILATTEPERMPETVLSRCQRIGLRRADDAEVESLVRKVAEGAGIIVEDDVYPFIARKGDGSFRDALALLDLVSSFNPDGATLKDALTALGSVPVEAVREVEEAALAGDGREVLARMDALARAGADFRQFGADLLDDARARLVKAYSEGHDEGRSTLLALVRALADFSMAPRHVSDARLGLEVLLLSLGPPSGEAPAEGGPRAKDEPSGPLAPRPRVEKKPAQRAGEGVDLAPLRAHFDRPGRLHVAHLLADVRGEREGDTLHLVFPLKGGEFVRASEPDIERLIAEGVHAVFGNDVSVTMSMEAREG